MHHIDENGDIEPQLLTIGAPLDHDGKELIDELIELGKNGLGKYVGRYDLKNSFAKCRAFNYRGYIIEKPININLSLLVIQKMENDTYKAYQKVEKGMRGIVKFQNEEKAQSILSKLFNNPLYHSPKFYQERLRVIRERIDWKKAKNYEGFKDVIEKIYKESLDIAEIFKQGSEEFLCQKRYLENLSMPNSNQNLYLANFGNYLLTASKYSISYQDGNQITAKKVEKKSLTKEDFNIVLSSLDDIGFENTILNLYSAEIEGFKIIKHNSFPWSDEMNLEVYQQGVNLIVWGMLARGIFNNILEIEQFLGQIKYPPEILIKNRYQVFTSVYLEQIKGQGWDVKKLSYLNSFDSLFLT